jgi:hypothetical protein
MRESEVERASEFLLPLRGVGGDSCIEGGDSCSDGGDRRRAEAARPSRGDFAMASSLALFWRHMSSSSLMLLMIRGME